MADALACFSRALGCVSRRLLFALLALVAFPVAANTAITVPALGSGFNYYQGSYSLGWSFTANTSIQVTALGFYDDLQNGLVQAHPVAIYDKATQALLASATVSPTDPLSGYFRYVSLATPLALTAGNTYVVMTWVGRETYLAFGAIDPLWSVDAAITYGQSAVNYANPSATTILYPDTFSAGGDFGPNFQFTAGAAPAPAASLSPTSLSFPAQSVGVTSAAQAVTFSNVGTAPLTIAGIATAGDFATSSTCAATLAPGASCTLTATFTPLVAGTRTGTITISDDAPGAPHVVALSGAGVSSGVPILSVPSGVTFPPTQVGTQSASTNVTVLNAGPAVLLIAASEIVGSDFVLGSDGCTGVAVVPNTTCTLNLIFVPSSTGSILATLRFVSNADGSPTYVTLAGTGTSAPTGTLAASPDSLAFADQLTGSTSAPRAVTVTNTGNYPVNVSSVNASAEFPQSNDCTRIAPGGSCSVSVTFRPTVSGARTGALTLVSDASNPSLQVALSGRGTFIPAPVIRLSATSLAFGNRLTGVASSPQEVTLSNVGSADLAIGGFVIKGEFTQTNNCPALVSPGASCRINVNFAASVPGDRTGTLQVSSNAASGNASVDLTGKGCRLFSLRASRLVTLACQ